GTMRLKTRLEVPQKGWSFLFVPNELLGVTRRVRIKGTINGKPFAATANPWRDNSHVVTFNQKMRVELGLNGDEDVEVEFAIDNSPVESKIPDDLLAALLAAAGAEEAFRKLAASHRKECIVWIEEAKQPATRARRIEKTVTKIVERITTGG
ncbi:MAG: YdeI/OmpD-associated family protein, partial [Chloroflexi bacterium]|nr:YdeI/OmpD-associated family protein [Chloroflexota bacterium]